MDWPKCVDVGNGSEDCVAALTFCSECSPLKVEAWMAYDDCVFGVEVGVAVADCMKTQYRINDIGGVLVILEHMGLDPYMPVCVSIDPGGTPVYPDA